MSKKIVITAGGTGGHIFPAEGIAHELIARRHEAQVLFVGGALAANRYFDREAFAYRSVDCGSIAHKNPLKLAASGWKILKGVAQSMQILHAYKPDLVLGFGSYYTFPTLIAAKALGIPIVLHEANSVPGMVNRLLSRYVRVVGLHFPDAAQNLKGVCVEVGMPMRKGFRRGLIDKAAALNYYQLDCQGPVLLVFGGSQGAQSLNKWMKEACAHPLFPSTLRVLHFTGKPAASEELRAMYAQKGVKAIVKDFEPRMDYAWRAANVALVRAGAGSISEAMEFEVPSLLVPYPHAADNHQQKNAAFFSCQVGGGVTHAEEAFSSVLLAKALRDLLSNGQAGLHNMQEAISTYKQKIRRRDLCDVIEELLESL